MIIFNNLKQQEMETLGIFLNHGIFSNETST